jgi:hypothetical protein
MWIEVYTAFFSVVAAERVCRAAEGAKLELPIAGVYSLADAEIEHECLAAAPMLARSYRELTRLNSFLQRGVQWTISKE